MLNFRFFALCCLPALLLLTSPAATAQSAPPKEARVKKEAKVKTKEARVKTKEAKVGKAKSKVKTSSRDELVTISTSQGDIRLLLFEDTPLHRANFLKKASSGFYNGTTFHRIIQDFMIQGGDANSKDADPLNDGMGQPDEPTIPAEFAAGHKHNYGALAAARQGDFANPQKASSISQFYLVQNHDGTHFLDGQYTVYGQVIQGLDVIDKIAKLPKDGRDRPTTDVKMTMKVEKLKKKKITKLYGYNYQ